MNKKINVGFVAAVLAVRFHPRLSLVTFFACGLFFGCSSTSIAPNEEALAVLVDGTGTYSRPITTDSALAQQFFDQGLRLTWGYYFPESAASHQEALRHDPGRGSVRCRSHEA